MTAPMVGGPAPKPRKRTPHFNTYAEVDVTISPRELEEAGWRYVGGEDTIANDPGRILDIVRRWHDDHHPGPWCWCRDDLCRELIDAEAMTDE